MIATPDGSPTSNASMDRQPRRTCLHGQLQKTKFCMYHLKGTCQFGDDCAFAHSVKEIQAMPDLRKTRLCTKENCNDPNCTFAHGEEELRSTDMFFKKTLCIWNEKGKCRNGEQCRFAHGQEQLRRNQEGAAAAEAPAQAPTNSVVNNARRKGQRAAGGGSRRLATIPAEPMKILPTGIASSIPPATPYPNSMEDECSTTWSGSGRSGGSGSGEDLRAELDRLRVSISALSMQCSSIQQHMYLQPDRSPEVMDMLQQPSVLPLPTYAPAAWSGSADQVNMMNANVAAMLLGPKAEMYDAKAASPFNMRDFGGAFMPHMAPPGLFDWQGA